MTTGQKEKSGKTISGMKMLDLTRDLERCQKALRNKKLLPQSVKYYSRRAKLLEAEIARKR